MRKVAVVAAALALADPAQAQDLATLKGCYAETSLAGTFLAAGPREATGAIGGGCDMTMANVTVGGGIRATWGDFTAGSVFGKLGVLLNPFASVYALGVWSVPDWKIAKVGQLSLGAGTEISIHSLVPHMSLFAEGTIGVSKFGPATSRDDIETRIGVRYRF